MIGAMRDALGMALRGRETLARLAFAGALTVAAGWLMSFPAWSATPSTSPDPTGVTFDGKTYTNRLIESRDPYLLLHAHNPVDWYPWGPGALQAAKRENKPIFVSIGYSTCYWCHVAEREIYSNPHIAKLMNQWFINVKVDREQRPDIDRVYMLATQIMTGTGGWPNNVFLTPDLKPFYAGSYFPPQDRADGRPGFPRILRTLHDAWINDPGKVAAVSSRVYQALRQAEQDATQAGATPLAPRQWLDQAVREAAGRFDELQAGFGDRVSKFPQSPLLSMLLAAGARDQDARALGMATQTLEAMAEGGVMDQLGGGFHRYSTEPSWSVPHFEKMLYDNAQLLGIYGRAYAETKKPLFDWVARRTAAYLTRDMMAAGGGFYSAQDAEADGAEGATYVWTRAQIEAALGVADAARFLTLYSLTPMPPALSGHKQAEGGVLRLDRDHAETLAQKGHLVSAIEALRPLREKLLAARNKRPQPARDEKIVTAADALAIIGFADAGDALRDPALTKVALRTADWVWRHAFDPASATLKHQFFHGYAVDDGFLDDYALLGQAFLTLHRRTGEAQWLARARRLADSMLERFARRDGHLVATWDAGLPVAPPAEGDSAQPSGRSSAIALLLELATATGDKRYVAAARRALAPLAAQVAAAPLEWGALLVPLNRSILAEAPSLPDSADHVHARGQIAPGQQGAELEVTVEVDPGYHINANPASDPDLIPTRLSLSGQPDVKVDYPAAQIFKPPFAPEGIAVYQGRITLRAGLAQPLAGPPPVAKLRVQACNDQVCLAPATIAVPIDARPQ